MKRTCPNCHRTYETILNPSNTDSDSWIKNEFPKSQWWEREQIISGMCSDSCFNDFNNEDYDPF